MIYKKFTKAMAGPFKPKYGDIVVYAGFGYYFQPNGSRCYVYARKEDLGTPHKACYSPSRSSIYPPLPGITVMGTYVPRRRPKAEVEYEVRMIKKELEMLRDIDKRYGIQ